MIVVAAFGEETLFRAYLFESFGKLFWIQSVGQRSNCAAHLRMVWT